MTNPSEPSEVQRIAQLVHDLRQPLSALRLLVDSASALDLPDDAAAIVRAIGEQVDDAVAVARKISRVVD